VDSGLPGAEKVKAKSESGIAFVVADWETTTSFFNCHDDEPLFLDSLEPAIPAIPHRSRTIERLRF